MTAMPTITPDQFNLLEFDTVKTPAPDAPVEVIELDLVDDPRHTTCLTCNQARPVNDQSICQACATVTEPSDLDFGVPTEVEAPPHELTAIASESAANAASPSGAFRSIRQVTAANEVRGVTAGAENAEHDTRGIVHLPRPGSIPVLERPVAERRLIVGQSTNEAEREVLRPGKLEAGQVVAGAVAAGNGILVGWHGDRQITRAVLLEALRGIGREEWAPKPKNARAQAGRAMAAAGSSYHCKADRKGAVTANEGANVSGQHRWRFGRIDTMGQPGDHYGMTVLVMTLEPDGRLHGAGDQVLAQAIIADYTERCAKELYNSGDITPWLVSTLEAHCGAVNYAVGHYVPARHRESAIQLIGAVSATGWGHEWLGSKERPALPIATCDELRDGIARGLKDEVAQVLDKLHTERETAAAEKARRLEIARAGGTTDLILEASAIKLSGDIGPERAATFLKELRAIAGRVAAYSEILGDERTGSARRAVQEAVNSLEGLLGEHDNGISQRFSAVWDEIMFETRKDGGVL
jgi:hypothetical protein